MRRPAFPPDLLNPSGRVEYDDRGNAVWQWKLDSEQPPAYLDCSGLAVADDAPSTGGMAQLNRQASRLGYDPYATGLIEKNARRKPRDLRELSKWIELKRRMDSPSNDE